MRNGPFVWCGLARRSMASRRIASGLWASRPAGIWRRLPGRISMRGTRQRPTPSTAPAARRVFLGRASPGFSFANSTPSARAGSRPDFLVLCYPVISFTNYVHRGSMTFLLGENPDPKLVENLSNELQVTAQTPPAFLFHTDADKTVPVENSVLFYLAMRKSGVPAELHIYEHGSHGVGLAQNDPALSSWPGRLADWLRGRGLLTARAPQ